MGKQEIVVKAGKFNDHFESNTENFEGMHRGYDYGVKSKEEEKIMKFCASMNITEERIHQSRKVQVI